MENTVSMSHQIFRTYIKVYVGGKKQKLYISINNTEFIIMAPNTMVSTSVFIMASGVKFVYLAIYLILIFFTKNCFIVHILFHFRINTSIQNFT